MSVFTTLLAHAHGEVSAKEVLRVLGAGRDAYGRVVDVESAYEARISPGLGVTPWTVGENEMASLLSARCAFALVALGESFYDADVLADPHTEGWVPPLTLQQMQLILKQVEPWLVRSKSAEVSSRYRLLQEVSFLPADPPEKLEAEDCPKAHLTSWVMALNGTPTRPGIRGRAEAALATFITHAGTGHQDDVELVQRLMVEATTAADWVEGLWGDGSGEFSSDLHEEMENTIYKAVKLFYHVLQLTAMPTLIGQYQNRGFALTDDQRRYMLPLPGMPGFDMWCLTDPAAVREEKGNPRSVRAIDLLWSNDPDPAATLAILAEINHALGAKWIAYATESGRPTFRADGRNRKGKYFCCPWSPVYVVVTPDGIEIGGVWLPYGTEFTFDVSAEKVLKRRGPFVRHIRPGVYSYTPEKDYCDGVGEHHSDDDDDD